MPLAMLRRQRHFQRWLIKGWGVFFMREFMIRRLLEAPIIRPLRDQYKRMLAVQEAALAERNEALAARDAALAERNEALAARDAALAERNEALAARDAALAERNEALAARDAALAERNEALAARDAALAEKALDYGSGRMPHKRDAKLFDFRAPSQLALRFAPAQRILVIGSCFAEGIVGHVHRAIPECQVDYILYNHYTELPSEPPRPISEYDFQVILLPLRSVIPEGAYMRLNYTDIAAHESFFKDSLSRLHQLLDGALIYARRFGKLTFIANFLVPQQSPLGRLLPKADLRNLAYVCQRLNAELETVVGSLQDVHVVDLDGIAAGFGKSWIQDDILCVSSHGTFLGDWDSQYDNNRLEPVVPITQQVPCCFIHEFSGAIWQEIAAMYRTLRQVDPIKMVVVDLDDTLWRGVAVDAQSIDAFMTEGWPLGFVEALQYLKKRGIIIAVISKNERTLIENILPHLYKNTIELGDFAAVKINWRPKVENMEELLSEVNLLPRNVLFIDDSPVERAAMKAAFPDMRVLGGNPYELRRLLMWAPETQVAVITDESSRRTEMIKAQIDREQSRRRLSREEFLTSLQIKFRIFTLTTPDHPKFPRAFELLNKTNQFNTTGKRWSIEEISKNLEEGFTIYAFEVEDIYTKYGLVGVIIIQGSTFEQFVMSCRVVGLDVEQAAVSLLASQMSASQEGLIRAVTRDTDANLLSRDLWRRCGFEWQEDHWMADPHKIPPVPPHIEIVQ
jgi:FkbH-like protein